MDSPVHLPRYSQVEPRYSQVERDNAHNQCNVRETGHLTMPLSPHRLRGQGQAEQRARSEEPDQRGSYAITRALTIANHSNQIVDNANDITQQIAYSTDNNGNYGGDINSNSVTAVTTGQTTDTNMPGTSRRTNHQPSTARSRTHHPRCTCCHRSLLNGNPRMPATSRVVNGNWLAS